LAISVRTVLSTGRPVAFTWRGREQRLAQVWGPERIETGWWREAPIRRDYYRVDTENGCRFWLFRRLSDGQWFLHGWFE
jgi:protein ImuB